MLAPSLDLVAALVERVVPAILAVALLVIHFLELVLRWHLSLAVQPSLLPGESSTLRITLRCLPVSRLIALIDCFILSRRTMSCSSMGDVLLAI